MNLDASVDNFAELLFIDEEINLKLEVVLRIASVNKTEILRDSPLKITRPMVVETSFLTGLPSISLVMRILILAWSPMVPSS